MMKNTVENLVPYKDCTGCGSCKNTCPKEAIELIKDNEGFYKYKVNSSKCIDCGLCVSHCPVVEPVYKNNAEPQCYAVWAPDDIRMESSSGGVFSLLADYIAEEKGYVAGVVYDDSFQPKHILSNQKEDFLKMRGSKYMQSDTQNVFQKIKEVLETQKHTKVLFTGMPCQVAGLNKFLGKDYDNLYTVELICHGITSKKVFDKYVEKVFQGKQLTEIEFKKKTPWGWHAGINAKFEDGTSYRQPAEKDLYFQDYLKNISKSQTCENCKFNRLPRQADLTIGDFWRISNFKPEWNDNKGTSVVLVNTPKGESLYQGIVPLAQKTEAVPLSFAIKGNGSLIAPYKNHMRREKFFRELDLIPFQKLSQHCMDNTFDVGIVGLWYGLNYGSILTYYALYCVVNQLGYDAIMVNKPDFIWRPLYEDPGTIANRFINKHCSVSGLHKKEAFPLLNQHCDTFIIGSDVVWNYEICGREGGNFFYLDFVDDTKKKIAYAASFGGGYHAPGDEEFRNRYYAQKFDAVSVREDAAVQLCQKHFGIQATKVLDPVFLCDISFFEKAADESKVDISVPYVMTYILGGNDLQKNIILNVADKLEIKKLINVVNPNNPTRVIGALKLEPAPQPDVEDWLQYMRRCSFFVGDSFHGLCFAILFRRPFLIAISKNMPSKDRFQTLLAICGLEERLWYIEEDNSDKYGVIHQEIDYDAVYERLEAYKKGSRKWLIQALEAPKKVQNEYLTKIPDDCDLELFYLARSVYENHGGRKVVTWGENKEFNRILKKYFDIDVPYWVAKNKALVNGTTIHDFEEISGKSREYYIVIPTTPWNQSDLDLFSKYGYTEIRDFIYRYHKPIVIETGDFTSKKYFDAYGNKISGKVTDFCKLQLQGFGNEISIGKNNKAATPISIPMSGCAKVEIGNECSFGRNCVIVFAGNLHSSVSKVTIHDNCVLGYDIEFRVFANIIDKNSSEILINKNTTLGRGCEFSANTGNKIIIGEDCMFSYDVLLQAGDGHAIFDVTSSSRINGKNSHKTNLVLGDHVWVGRKSTILNNSNIGNGSIIGAGAVVKGYFPNNCVLAGNPARKVKENIAWSRNSAAIDMISSCKEHNVDITRNAKPPIAGKNVLVLGGTKFMGIHLVNELLKLGNNVTIATRGLAKDHFGDRVTRIILDRGNEQSVRNALFGKYYDVVFDNTAYCSLYVKYLMDMVKCEKYIQLSSTVTYIPLKLNLKESDFDPIHYSQKWCDVDVSYGEGKKQAECAIYQKYPSTKAVTVRIPYVTNTDRLYFYCKNILTGTPMNIDTMERGMTFVRSEEVGKFLPWIAAQNFTGPINLASVGTVTVGMIIEYIEKKVGKKAVINVNGKSHPFGGYSFNVNMDLAKKLDYKCSNLDDWFWALMDEYIERAKKEYGK